MEARTERTKRARQSASVASGSGIGPAKQLMQMAWEPCAVPVWEGLLGCERGRDGASSSFFFAFAAALHGLKSQFEDPFGDLGHVQQVIPLMV